jgi:hypothetical protein
MQPKKFVKVALFMDSGPVMPCPAKKKAHTINLSWSGLFFTIIMFLHQPATGEFYPA